MAAHAMFQKQNPKFEARNPKQIRNPNYQMFKTVADKTLDYNV
jgi:hypothetical protein